MKSQDRNSCSFVLFMDLKPVVKQYFELRKCSKLRRVCKITLSEFKRQIYIYIYKLKLNIKFTHGDELLFQIKFIKFKPLSGTCLIFYLSSQIKIVKVTFCLHERVSSKIQIFFTNTRTFLIFRLP